MRSDDLGVTETTNSVCRHCGSIAKLISFGLTQVIRSFIDGRIKDFMFVLWKVLAGVSRTGAVRYLWVGGDEAPSVMFSGWGRPGVVWQGTSRLEGVRGRGGGGRVQTLVLLWRPKGLRGGKALIESSGNGRGAFFQKQHCKKNN